MAERQNEGSGPETIFPDNVPWDEFWGMAGAVEEKSIQRCFQEAIWCLRNGGFRAAAVLGWVATVAHLRRLSESLPQIVIEAYLGKARSKDGRDFLSMCRQLTIFGLRTNETTSRDADLQALLNLRDGWVHTPIQGIEHSGRDEVIRLLRNCGHLLTTRTVEFGEHATVAKLAKNRQLSRPLEPVEADRLIDFVAVDEMHELADTLLSDCLQHSRPGAAESQSYVDTEESIPAREVEEAEDEEWLKSDTSLASLWTATYLRLASEEQVKLLGKLIHEFAEAVHLPDDLQELIDLVAEGESLQDVVGIRTLAELANLPVWKKGNAPEKYRAVFYLCLARNPGELASLSDTAKKEIVEQAPENYRQPLMEAFNGHVS